MNINMKNIKMKNIKYLLLFVFAGLIVSCEDADTTPLGGGGDIISKGTHIQSLTISIDDMEGVIVDEYLDDEENVKKDSDGNDLRTITIDDIPFATSLAGVVISVEKSYNSVMVPASDTAIDFVDGVPQTLTLTSESGNSTGVYQVTLNLGEPSDDSDLFLDVFKEDEAAAADVLVMEEGGNYFVDYPEEGAADQTINIQVSVDAAISLVDKKLSFTTGLGTLEDTGIVDVDNVDLKVLVGFDTDATQEVTVTAEDGTTSVYSITLKNTYETGAVLTFTGIGALVDGANITDLNIRYIMGEDRFTRIIRVEVPTGAVDLLDFKYTLSTGVSEEGSFGNPTFSSISDVFTITSEDRKTTMKYFVEYTRKSDSFVDLYVEGYTYKGVDYYFDAFYRAEKDEDGNYEIALGLPGTVDLTEGVTLITSISEGSFQDVVLTEFKDGTAQVVVVTANDSVPESGSTEEIPATTRTYSVKIK